MQAAPNAAPDPPESAGPGTQEAQPEKMSKNKCKTFDLLAKNIIY
jgi:hypothetical protein